MGTSSLSCCVSRASSGVPLLLGVVSDEADSGSAAGSPRSRRHDVSSDATRSPAAEADAGIGPGTPPQPPPPQLRAREALNRRAWLGQSKLFQALRGSGRHRGVASTAATARHSSNATLAQAASRLREMQSAEPTSAGCPTEIGLCVQGSISSGSQQQSPGSPTAFAHSNADQDSDNQQREAQASHVASTPFGIHVHEILHQNGQAQQSLSSSGVIHDTLDANPHQRGSLSPEHAEHGHSGLQMHADVGSEHSHAGEHVTIPSGAKESSEIRAITIHVDARGTVFDALQWPRP